MPDCSSILEQPSELDAAVPPSSGTRVAYLMSRFPELTQTFVLYEMLAVEQHQAPVAVYPLLRGGHTARHADGASIWRKLWDMRGRHRTAARMHPEAAAVVARAHYAPFFSLAILAAQLHYLIRKPAAYWRALWTLVCGAWGSSNFLFGGLAVFPKAVYFARKMSDQGITHIHAHFANHPATAAMVIHHLTGIPYSFTAHGSDLHRDRHLLREKVSAAKFVVAISQYNREVIENHCGPTARGRVEIIHCGVDTELFHPAPRPHRTESSSQLRILSVGTLHEVKGQKYLIEACGELQRRGVEFDCQFIGDGPDRKLLQDLIDKLQLGDRVRLLGLRTRPEIVECMQAADVLVAPSVPSRSGRREGIPVVLMEAMACGLPVVASDLSGIPELVEHERSGLLAPPGDVDQLVAALERLQRDSQLCRMLGEGARERVVDSFNQSKNAARLAERFAESRSL
jgi:glycosyltransferase involved in cell wall biosynthesis